MKTFAFVVCFAISCVLAAPRNLKQVHEDCQIQHHLDDNVFEAIHKGEPFDRTLAGAHMLCMSTKLGSMNEDGTVNRAGLKSALAHEIRDEAKLEEVVNKCTVNESTPGETALTLSKCVRENTPKGRHGHRHGHHHEHHHGHNHQIVLTAQPKLKQIFDDCQVQHHLDDDVIEAIRKDEPFDRTLVGAHMVCIGTKSGFINEDGTINRAGLKTALTQHIQDEARLEEVVNKCAVNESTPGETALKLSRCFRENLPKGRHGHGPHHGRHHVHIHIHQINHQSSEESTVILR